jgi:hypothetical protein
MKRHRWNRWKAAAAVAAISAAAAASSAAWAAGEGYAGPVITPSSLDFGTVALGTTSAAQSVSVSATQPMEGFPALNIVSITLPPGYTRSGGSCPASGTASNPCTIDIVFTPAALGANPGTGVISANINGAPAGQTNLALTGNAVQGANISVPSLSQWGLALLLAAVAASGAVLARRR